MGKEIFADQPGEAKGTDRDGHERREHQAAMPQRPIEQTDVAEAKTLEKSVEQIVESPERALSVSLFTFQAALVEIHFGFQKKVRHGGDQRARQQIRSEHRK